MFRYDHFASGAMQAKKNTKKNIVELDVYSFCSVVSQRRRTWVMRSTGQAVQNKPGRITSCMLLLLFLFLIRFMLYFVSSLVFFRRRTRGKGPIARGICASAPPNGPQTQLTSRQADIRAAGRQRVTIACRPDEPIVFRGRLTQPFRRTNCDTGFRLCRLRVLVSATNATVVLPTKQKVASRRPGKYPAVHRLFTDVSFSRGVKSRVKKVC